MLKRSKYKISFYYRISPTCSVTIKKNESRRIKISQDSGTDSQNTHNEQFEHNKMVERSGGKKLRSQSLNNARFSFLKHDVIRSDCDFFICFP